MTEINYVRLSLLWLERMKKSGVKQETDREERQIENMKEFWVVQFQKNILKKKKNNIMRLFGLNEIDERKIRLVVKIPFYPLYITLTYTPLFFQHH